MIVSSMRSKAVMKTPLNKTSEFKQHIMFPPQVLQTYLNYSTLRAQKSSHHTTLLKSRAKSAQPNLRKQHFANNILSIIAAESTLSQAHFPYLGSPNDPVLMGTPGTANILESIRENARNDVTSVNNRAILLEQQPKENPYARTHSGGEILDKMMMIQDHDSTLTIDDCKKSLITINDEDIGFYQRRQGSVGNEHQMTAHYKRESSTENGFQLQAAMMEKVVVKSPGRQTTDHVSESFKLLKQGSSLLHYPNKSSSNFSSGHGHRRSISNNNNLDLASFHEQPTKRTVLIRKSKGQNEIQQLAANPPPKEVMHAPRVTKQNTSVNNALQPLQYFVREDLQKSDLRMGGAYNTVKEAVKQLPRHGRAPPSVIRRNKELLQKSRNRKMTTERDVVKTNLLNQTNGFSRSVTHDQQLLQKFHIVPIAFTACINQYMNIEPSAKSTWYKASVNSRTPKMHRTFYNHTGAMSHLIIQQPEQAIDYQQQKMQRRLVEAFQQQQQRQREFIKNDIMPEQVHNEEETVNQNPLKVPIPMPRFSKPAESQISSVSKSKVNRHKNHAQPLQSDISSVMCGFQHENNIAPIPKSLSRSSGEARSQSNPRAREQAHLQNASKQEAADLHYASEKHIKMRLNLKTDVSQSTTFVKQDALLKPQGILRTHDSRFQRNQQTSHEKLVNKSAGHLDLTPPGIVSKKAVDDYTDGELAVVGIHIEKGDKLKANISPAKSNQSKRDT